MDKIVIKYLEGQASNNERRLLLEWLRNKENQTKFDFQKRSWLESRKGYIVDDLLKPYSQFQEIILEQNERKHQRTKTWMLFLKYASIFLLIVSFGTVLYMSGRHSNKKVAATTTVIAENGQVAKIILPDSSLVWLNSGSSLTYANDFGDQKRQVKLIGEGYFDVRKSGKTHFVVNAGRIDVEVLGTRFNVSSLAEEQRIKVVLEEGKVLLNDARTGGEIDRLVPGEMAAVDIVSGKVFKRAVKTKLYTSWKEGIIYIHNQPLWKVCQKLEKRYNQTFKIDHRIKNRRYTLSIRDESLDEIIEIIERITPVKSKQEGDIILLEPDN
jgi:ferric-dicitrate binding protein FerR (iron transport regulator)